MQFLNPAELLAQLSVMKGTEPAPVPVPVPVPVPAPAPAHAHAPHSNHAQRKEKAKELSVWATAAISVVNSQLADAAEASLDFLPRTYTCAADSSGVAGASGSSGDG